MTNRVTRVGLAVLVALLSLPAAAASAYADPTTGTITGRITRPDGSPAPTAFVQISDPNFVNPSVSVRPDQNGVYTAPDLVPGTYIVQVSDTGFNQYAHGKARSWLADRFTVTAGQTTTVDEQLLHTGRLQVTVTEHTGAPANAGVSLIDPATGLFAEGGRLDANGQIVIEALVGSYQVEITPFLADGNPDFFRKQWLHGKTSREEADLVVITAGGFGVETEQLITPGSITVTARDAGTGEALADFCAGAAASQGCSGGTGTVTLTGIQPGVWRVFAYTEDGRYFSGEIEATVVSGQTVPVSLALERATVIQTTIVDAATGAPIEGACVGLIDARSTLLPDGMGACSDASGRLVAGSMQGGRYRMFVMPPTGSGYGAQWVGVHGGTGVPEKARTIAAADGAIVTVPPVRLDRAGTITGSVVSETGNPFSFGFVSIHSYSDGAGPSYGSMVDENGRYTIDWLGPYEWALVFNATGHARQWSGFTTDRRDAKKLKVRNGQTTTFDIRLKVGTVLRVATVDRDGEPVQLEVNAFDAGSGETLGRVDSPGHQGFLHVLGGSLVKVRWDDFEANRSGWYDNDADFAHAKPVWIPGRGTKTITIVIPPA
jgi:hypothetical protein